MEDPQSSTESNADTSKARESRTRGSGLRLSDAEAVATTRRDMFGDGSLLDVLAGTPAASEAPAEEAPQPAPERANGQPPEPQTPDPAIRAAEPAPDAAPAGEFTQSLDAIIDSFPAEPPPSGDGPVFLAPLVRRPMDPQPEPATDWQGPRTSDIFLTLDGAERQVREAQSRAQAFDLWSLGTDAHGDGAINLRPPMDPLTADALPAQDETPAPVPEPAAEEPGDTSAAAVPAAPADGAAEPRAEARAPDVDDAGPPAEPAAARGPEFDIAPYPGTAPFPEPQSWQALSNPTDADAPATPDLAPEREPEPLEPPSFAHPPVPRAEEQTSILPEWPPNVPPFPEPLAPQQAAAAPEPFAEPPGALLEPPGMPPTAEAPSADAAAPLPEPFDAPPEQSEPPPFPDSPAPPAATPYREPLEVPRFAVHREPPAFDEVAPSSPPPPPTEAVEQVSAVTARIKAEATATAEALENLKRMLASTVPGPEPMHQPSPPATAVHATNPFQVRPQPQSRVQSRAYAAAQLREPPGLDHPDARPFMPSDPSLFLPLPVPGPDRNKSIYLLGFITGLGLSVMAGLALYFLLNA